MNDDHKIVEGDDFENKCFMAAITDEILFGSYGAEKTEKSIIVDSY